MPHSTEPLSDSERSQLRELEAEIQHGLRSFQRVGKALIEIRQQRLYRESHARFEEYCRVIWRLTDAHCLRLMNAYRVVENLKLEPGVSLPKNERQVRALTLLSDPEDQRRAWQAATADGGKPTGARVQREVNRLILKSLPPEEQLAAVQASERAALALADAAPPDQDPEARAWKRFDRIRRVLPRTVQRLAALHGKQAQPALRELDMVLSAVSRWRQEEPATPES